MLKIKLKLVCLKEQVGKSWAEKQLTDLNAVQSEKSLDLG